MTDAQVTKRYLPPNEKLIQEADQQEQRFCCLMLKDKNCVEAAITAGIQADWFWTDTYGELYGAVRRYYEASQSLVSYTTYEGLLGKVSKTPEEVTRKVRTWQETWALPVKTDDFAFLKNQIVSRNAQRTVATVLDNYYNRIMTATNGQQRLVEEFREAVAALPVGASADAVSKALAEMKSIGEFTSADAAKYDLIGDGYGRRTHVHQWVAGTGIGKSVGAMQAAFSWAIGRDFLGIKPVQVCRSLIIQSENDPVELGETKEKLYRFLKTTAAEEKQIEEFVQVDTTDLADEQFRDLLLAAGRRHNPDIIWIDPMYGYLRGDANRSEVVGVFLREILSRVAIELNCLIICLHHSGKQGGGKDQRATKDKSAFEWTYFGAGHSNQQALVRAVLAFESTRNDGRFVLHLAKRGHRSGLLDEYGKPLRKLPVRWSEGEDWGWQVDTGVDPANADADIEVTHLDLLRLIVELKGKELTKDCLYSFAREHLDIGEKRVDTHLARLEADGLVKCAEGASTGGRRPRVYRATDAGLAVINEKPAESPVTADEVTW